MAKISLLVAAEMEGTVEEGIAPPVNGLNNIFPIQIS